MAGKNSSLCRTFDMEERKTYQYVVIFSKFQGKLMLSRHKSRDTWETQGGHIEPGETPEQAARRELWEESGAEEFTLTPVCGYLAADESSEAAGAVFFAEISKMGNLPESEMAEVKLFPTLPENVTYPGITPLLFRRVEDCFQK